MRKLIPAFAIVIMGISTSAFGATIIVSQDYDFRDCAHRITNIASSTRVEMKGLDHSVRVALTNAEKTQVRALACVLIVSDENANQLHGGRECGAAGDEECAGRNN